MESDMADNLYAHETSIPPLADPLLRPAELLSVTALLADRSKIPDEPGIYAWWFKDALPEVPLDGTLSFDAHHLLYVGIAPRKPSASGSESKSTLRRRILRNHLGHRLASSTLRRSIATLLKGVLDLSISRNTAGKLVMPRSHEGRLTDWLIANAALTILPIAQPWQLEAALIQQGPALPLNLAGSAHPFRQRLSELRTFRHMIAI